ncbi:hypothetical protein BDK51DRAFT_40993 [Blyttiomyces helicus]|uniref:Uncharacterized protein n=1 Tax=Blyttiomyces helicus TaxID=388810 RepID=A0A4P9WP34_9FUNG|nr:hypothetical protein BDK51DRAFT_40993 [Blyttiomyces helicus]|eukprot:RKO93873.1 hypothetical protein BDK51DRAFT_40993 [Blyttiomyces helicus]
MLAQAISNPPTYPPFILWVAVTTPGRQGMSLRTACGRGGLPVTFRDLAKKILKSICDKNPAKFIIALLDKLNASTHPLEEAYTTSVNTTDRYGAWIPINLRERFHETRARVCARKRLVGDFMCDMVTNAGDGALLAAKAHAPAPSVKTKQNSTKNTRAPVGQDEKEEGDVDGEEDGESVDETDEEEVASKPTRARSPRIVRDRAGPA